MLLQILEEDVYETLPEYEEISLIDEILREFLSQHSLADMLKNVTNFIGGFDVTYKFRGQTYNGSLFDFRSGSFTNPHHQLTIRLSSDGFRYPKVKREDFVAVVTDHSGMFANEF